MSKIIDGEKIAQEIKKEVYDELKRIKNQFDISPKIASIMVGENPSIKAYVNNQRKLCNELGIEIEIFSFDNNIPQQEIEQKISQLNDAKDVNAIILNLPLPPHLNQKDLQNKISPLKDVEGITAENLGKLFYSETSSLIVAPCTALSVIECIKSTQIELKGKEVVIVGHSEIVGKPLLLLLLSSPLNSPTPTVCHISTKNLKEHTKRADILIVAAGKPNLITEDMIKEGAIVIDVGINIVKVLDKNGKEIIDEKTNKPKTKIVGDVDFENVFKKSSFITPVPGGVGVVTTCILAKNLINLIKIQNSLPVEGYKIII